MPSLVLPAVAPALPVPAASGNAAQGSAAADAPTPFPCDDRAMSPFAALLDRQLAAAANPSTEAGALPDLDASEGEAPDSAQQQTAMDIGALIQGLLAPVAAKLPGEVAVTRTAETIPDGGRMPATAPGLLQRGAPDDPRSPDTAAQLPGNRVQPEAWLPVAADRVDEAAIDAGADGKAATNADVKLPLPPMSSPEAPASGHAIQVQAHHPTPVERERVTVATPVGAPHWHEDLGNKVSMLIGKDVSSAELVLTPPSLGRVEVQLSVSGDQTSAVFVAATPAARDALEQALPKLREFLADAGIELAQASVGGDSSSRDGAGNGRSQGRHSGADGTDAVAESALPTARIRQLDGMVDTFV